MNQAGRNSVPVYVGREYRKLVNMKAAARDVRPSVIVEEALRAAYGDPAPVKAPEPCHEESNNPAESA